MYTLTFLAAFALSFPVFAQTLKIEKPDEFQFVHCVPSAALSEEKVTHYIIDVRNQNRHQLHKQFDIKRLKSTELNRLVMVEKNLLVNTLSDYDVSWISKVKELVFALNIIDNGGYAMDGELRSPEGKTEVRCTDSTLD